jgi:hypothetical protein
MVSNAAFAKIIETKGNREGKGRRGEKIVRLPQDFERGVEKKVSGFAR